MPLLPIPMTVSNAIKLQVLVSRLRGDFARISGDFDRAKCDTKAKCSDASDDKQATTTGSESGEHERGAKIEPRNSVTKRRLEEYFFRPLLSLTLQIQPSIRLNTR